MNIALIGYGKMGKTIESIAVSRGHTILLTVDYDNLSDLSAPKFEKVDVAIEFTRPESAVDNLMKCFDIGVPVVCGTTGWEREEKQVIEKCRRVSGGLFYSSNFSVGVNIFFAVNRFLASLMNSMPQYDVEMEEIHHTQKLDAPSGTALTLAKDVLKNIDRKTGWVNESSSDASELAIISKRIGATPGTHKVEYISLIDAIEIKHTAHSREGFALGAVLAAEWMVGKEGVFGMKDLLGF